MSKFFRAFLLTGTAAFGATTASASVVFDIYDSGTDMVFEFSGSLDTDSFSTIGPVFNLSTAGLGPTFFGVRTGEYQFYNAMGTGPSDLGVTTTLFSGDVLGDTFFYNHGTNVFGVSTSYVSGDDMSGSATFAGTEVSSTGLTDGTYQWTFGNGETLTLNVGATTPVPVPAGVLLLGTALGALGVARRRQNG